MSSRHDDHDHDHDAETVSEAVHENSWSANLELPEHGDDRERLVEEAIDAIEHTAPGYHVNLVTHAEHGHPETYLYDELEAVDGVRSIDWEFVEQCGCGGYVTRVHVEE